MRVLNLYAGIGGNRKLWKDVEVTAVENNPRIVEIYQDFFPNDKVVVVDAHQYLLEHFGEFDFIWSSPPCPSHSKINMINGLFPHKDNIRQIKHGGGIPPRFPDLKLYEEIILLKYWFKGKWVIENIYPYYKPLMLGKKIGRHLFWSNFHIQTISVSGDDISSRGDGRMNKKREHKLEFYINKYKLSERKATILRNCVNPYLGLHILNESKRDIQAELFR